MPPTPSKRANASRFRRFLIKLAILSVTSLLCVLVLEFVVRWTMPYYTPSTQMPFYFNAQENVVLGFSNRVSRQKTPKGDFDTTVRMNRLGLRDAKDVKDSRTNDIFVAGDSFSIGWGVDEHERYSNIMEKDLGVRVYNVAIPEDIRGYINTVAYAKRRGAQIHNLIVGLCMENDLWDYTSPVSSHEIYAQQMNPGRARKVFNWFKNHSALWTFASFTIQGTSSGRKLFEKLGISKSIEALTHPNTDDPKILAATRDEMLKLTTNYNSVVLIIPSRGLWWGRNMKTEDKIHTEMVRLLRERGVKLVDMRPGFEASGKPLQYYFANDPHWNPAGHKAAAEALEKFLREQPEWQAALTPAK